VDLVEQDGDLVLVMEDLGDQTLEGYVAEQRTQGRLLGGAEVAARGRQLAAALAEVHRRGLVYQDLKSTNVMITPADELKLIDFELAHPIGVPSGDILAGTPGYISPQRHAGSAPAIADDVYGLGALLYYMATGAEPSMAPQRLSLLDRPVRALNPAIGEELAAVIARCLDPDPARRYPTMALLDAALVAAASASEAPSPAACPSDPQRPSPAHYRRLASRLAATLCATAEQPWDGAGLAWSSEHPVAGGAQARAVNTGCAGTLLALAELTSVFDTPEHRRTVREAARWLAGAPSLAAEPLPGLYVGEAGIGAALLRAAQVLDDGDLLAHALERGARVALLPHTSPDLFHGSAGRLCFHLLLWDETGDPGRLAAAAAAGEFLLSCAEPAGEGEIGWRIPAGFDSLSGKLYLGYAHGAAGIADALLDLYEAGGDQRFRSAAEGAARLLKRTAAPSLVDGSGLDWPDTEGGHRRGAAWCHGATGVGRFFLHAARLGLTPDAALIARRAAHTVAEGARWLGPTQCHGLAGSIELLLDMYCGTGDQAYLDDARALARLLEAFAQEQDGKLVWPSETPDIVAPDFMVGYAGVAACLLRLGDPGRRPHLLSRHGFRRSPRAAPPAPGRTRAR